MKKTLKSGVLTLITLTTLGFSGCKKATDPPPPALTTYVHMDNHSYMCYTGVSPVDIAYNGWGLLDISIDEKNGGGNPFKRHYSLYGSNSLLDPSGNCVQVEIPKNSPATFTAYLYEKRRDPQCLAPPQGMCVKWIKSSTIPSVNNGASSCGQAITINITEIDPGFFATCNI